MADHNTLPPIMTHRCRNKPSSKIVKWPATTATTLNCTDRTQDFILPIKTVAPKLRLLHHQLEQFLEQELYCLSCPPRGPHILSDMLLQAHRETFDMLIQEFKTYKPLLSSIKNEYDLYIAHQEGLIQELLPIKNKLLIKGDNEWKIEQLKQAMQLQNIDEEKLHLECKKLNATITELQNELDSFKAQIRKLQDELMKIYEKYREEADARTLLNNEITVLKEQLAMKKTEELNDVKERNTMLQLKVIHLREDLRSAHQRLDKQTEQFKEVVPREVHELTQANYCDLEKDFETVQTQHANLVEEHSILLDLHKKLKEQSNNIPCTSLSSMPTQPDWSVEEKCLNNESASKMVEQVHAHVTIDDEKHKMMPMKDAQVLKIL